MLLRKHGQGSVHTHGRHCLRPVKGHGKNHGLILFIGVTVCFLESQTFFVLHGGNTFVGNRKVLYTAQVGIQPLPVWVAGRVVVLKLIVINEPSLPCVHQQHFAGAQAVLFHHLCLVNVYGAHLGGQYHVTVLCYVVPGGTKPVSVQHSPHHVAVREKDGSRTVPRLHHGGVISVEILYFAVHILVIFPGRGNGDHDSQRQIHTAHNHKFQGIVQHGGIRAFLVYDGQHLVHVVPEILGFHVLLPGHHLIHIAADGIDFAVVDNEAVGVGPHPAGIGVGAESGMYNGNGRLIIFILEI